jgi:hypothetical protein
LKSALRALSPAFPQLAKIDKGRLVTEVRFLRHSRIEHDILELSGGSGNLGNLVGRYQRRFENTGRAGSAGPFRPGGVVPLARLRRDAGLADATSIGGARRLAGTKIPLRILSRRHSQTVSQRAVYKYTFRPLKHPVIVLVDNDSGSAPVFAAMKQQKINVSQSTTDDFYHVCFNLYVVKTPEIGSVGTSTIENFLDDAALSEKIQGRTLSLAKEYDRAKHFGKMELADLIIRPRYASLDFGGFVPLLDRLVSVIKDYRTRVL